MDVPNRAPWINIAVGILAIISPFAMAGSTYAAKWDMVITGIIIGLVAIAEMSVYARSSRMHYWPVINILAGVWLFISTSFAVGNPGLAWSNIVLGVVSIVTACVVLSYERVHTLAGDIRHTHTT